MLKINNTMTMFPESEYERVYTGSLINVQFLQTILQDNGINSITRDDMKSGMMAGFGGGIPDHIQLFVKKTDIENALPIIKQSLT
ncbi:hypothetical protein ATO12_07285 [Aquimarina atlantica]|uniref:DUF2007 domain-containing protein n=1 Tax=Aquimarina atlantica TaxID=1317122 RepID=A0A023BNF9_9FLAO|nr:DUF2007 domain-containing protein [Aquimarina atlantica]EZH71494.1 hypothetical protein ATO12_07285 [Aquimarina atlantica]